jgi:hypothetical protein
MRIVEDKNYERGGKMRQNIKQFGFDEELSQLINFYTSNPLLIPLAIELGKSTRHMYAAATARQLLDMTGNDASNSDTFLMPASI